MKRTNRKIFPQNANIICLFAVLQIVLIGPSSLNPASDALAIPAAHAKQDREYDLVSGIPAALNKLPALPAANPHDPIPGQDYPETWINSSPTDRPAAEHPDLNLIIRGYTRIEAPKELVFYYGNTDAGAPQLRGLFGDDRLPTISSVYRVFDWEWGQYRRGKTVDDPEVTLVGFATTPGEIIYLPPSGYSIGEGFNALVLYADPKRLTIKYTREDNVVSGYTLHLENICPEPRLLAVYENCNNNTRGHLPALRSAHALGRACGSELGVAIRDNGDFMDPRSSKDWWVK